MIPKNDFQGSTPSLCEFNPDHIPFQKSVINDVRCNFDYKTGIKQLLLSGSVGSAKSLVVAHLLVTHCLLYPKARAMMGRLVLQDLKDTLIQKVIEHIGEDLVEGKDYERNKSANKFTFDNGSELISRSWHDKNFRKFRSLELSAAAIEEASENSTEYKQAYFEIIQRVGRLPHVPESWVILATNPDSPSHWLYKHFMVEKNDNRKVYYSKTSDNPFLPDIYIQNLKENLDEKQAQRMLEGLWVEINQDNIYYNYNRDRNYKDQIYHVNPNYPVDLSFDFNIGEGKPMSAMTSQFIDGVFHCFRTFIVEGARTTDILDEINATGIFNSHKEFRIFGDASGRSRDTRSIRSDYDIIKTYISNHDAKPNLTYNVPLSNPPIRDRHNLVNAQCHNANGLVKLFVYREAEPLDEGLRLTKLKKGGNYIEDDSFRHQHVTTALGYMIHYLLVKWREPPKSYRR